MINILRYKDADYDQKLAHITEKSSLFDEGIEQRTRAIIETVRTRGDKGLCELMLHFDGARLTPNDLSIRANELDRCVAQVSNDFAEAMRVTSRNVKAFSERSIRRDWKMKNTQGGVVGEKFDPFGRVGIYVPGGHAPLVSTALMTIGLAKAAGCPEIVVCSPCNKEGNLHPAVVYAAVLAGATEIYRVGGAQAIAAMALGTQTIARVQKIFGPGNAYVTAAKRLLFGRVSIDLLSGPSEGLILADKTANPAYVASDLLAQAEHGSGHERVWLITPSANLLKAVHTELGRQLATLKRREFIEKSFAKNGWLIQVRSMEAALDVTNSIAPEHCEIMAPNPQLLAKRIVTAGAIFLGANTPIVLGDYVAGPSHELPTGGAGSSFAGLSVDQFQRRTALLQYDQKALVKSLPYVQQFAEVEGLEAHGRSIALRSRPWATKHR